MRTLFTNAKLTDEPQAATAQTYTVLVEDSRIASIAIQSDENGPGSVSVDRVIDLAGLYLAPSMIDHHVHFSVWAKARKRVSMANVDTLVEALHKLEEAARHYDQTKQPALVAAGLHLGKWSDADIARMRKHTIDGVLPAQVPVMVLMNDLHSAWCNSAMLDLFQIAEGARGYNGLLLERDCFDAMNKLDAMQAGQIWDDLADASAAAAQKGVTEIIDLDIDRNLVNWPERIQRGLKSLRVQCGIYPQFLRDALSLGLPSGAEVPGGQGLLTVGPAKIISDGSLGTRTACCHHAYPSPPAAANDHGLLNYTPEEFRRYFDTAISSGLRLAIHAIGDKAHSFIFDVLEGLERRPLPGSTIEHAQLLLLDDLIRFKAQGLAASIQPQHAVDDIELAETFWPGCVERAFPYASLLDAGIEIKLGSDAPVAPLDPWLAMAAAISRCRPGEDKPWHPEQRISTRAAYEASTTGRRTRIRVGDVADLCVLELDPLTAGADEIRSIRVHATMLNGEFTWKETTL